MARRKGDIANVVDPDGNVFEDDGTVLIPEVQDDFPIASAETDALRLQIKNLTQSISNCYWDLSTLVYKVNKERLYKTWGYGQFEDWANLELGFKKRKAYYLIEFQNYCMNDLKTLLPDSAQYSEAVEQLKEVGWTKALEIAKSKILSKENCYQLLEEAKVDKIDEFVDKINIIKTQEKLDKGDNGVTENTMKKVKATFKLTTAQEELLQSAIEKAKVAINREDVSPEFALEYITGDFLAGAVSSLEAALSQIERIHNVSVVAFSDDDKKVVYGGDTLVAISQAVGG